MSAPGVRSAKGARRRADIVEAAAALLSEQGPAAITHRAVSERSGCSLSATTYYFDGIDELMAEAAARNIETWIERARAVVDTVADEELPLTDEGRAKVLLAACLPQRTPLDKHYHQLLAASQSPLVTAAYRRGRRHLDEAVGELIERMDIPLTAAQVYAVVDGAAVSAISEGRDVRETALALLEQFLASAARQETVTV